LFIKELWNFKLQKIPQYYLEKMSILNLIKKNWKKTIVDVFSPFKLAKIGHYKKNELNNKNKHLFSTSYLFNNISYRPLKMINYTNLKKKINILFILFFLIM
jgi:hypothetical protein